MHAYALARASWRRHSAGLDFDRAAPEWVTRHQVRHRVSQGANMRQMRAYFSQRLTDFMPTPRAVLGRVLLCVTLLVTLSTSPTWAADPDVVIQKAELTSLTGTRQVVLPHTLAPTDFLPEGSRVVYRSTFSLRAVPAEPLGFYVPKMSVSGNVYINGKWAGSCLPGRLEEIRCTNKPQLFEASPDLLKTGENTIEFEIYASRHQKNGLTAITYGDLSGIFDRLYWPLHWLKADFLVGMSWVSLVFGLVSLSAFFILRKEYAYVWFGIACMAHAASLAHLLMGQPLLEVDAFLRVGVLLRLTTFVSFVMIFLTLIRKFRLWMGGTFAALLVITLAAINLINSFANLALFLAPMLLFSFALLVQSIRWASQSDHPLRVLLVWLALAMLLSAVYDWRTLSGAGGIEKSFIFPYTYTAILIIFGVTVTRYVARMLKLSLVNLYQAERRNAERMAYAVTKNIPVGTYTLIFGVNKAPPKFMFVSDRFLEITGLSRRKLRNGVEDMLALLHAGDVASWESLMGRRPGEHEKISKLFRLFPAPGLMRWLSTEAIPRQLPDGSTIYEGVLLDKTEEMQAKTEADRVNRALQAQAIENSKTQERELLLRDMHDGFGSQLASIRMLAEKGRIPKDKFPEALMELSADLHLVVDTLGQANTTLEEALADMRYRWDKRFAKSDLPVTWAIDLANLPALPQRSILHALRLLQEALINAFKHAKADHVVVTARYDAAIDGLTLSVRDDGVGLQQTTKGGRGIHNMQQRPRPPFSTRSPKSSRALGMCRDCSSSAIITLTGATSLP